MYTNLVLDKKNLLSIFQMKAKYIFVKTIYIHQLLIIVYMLLITPEILLSEMLLSWIGPQELTI